MRDIYIILESDREKGNAVKLLQKLYENLIISAGKKNCCNENESE